VPAPSGLSEVDTAANASAHAVKFLMLSINFHPEQISTGKYSTELSEHVAAAGMDVRVITTPPYYPEWRIWPGYRGWKYSAETHGGMTIYRCPLWVPRRVRPVTRILHLSSFAVSSAPALLRQLPWRPDWIFVVVPTMLLAPAALTLAALTNARTWLHVQDFELHAAFGLKLLGGRLTYFVGHSAEKAIVRRFDRVSTISEPMHARLLEAGVPRDRASLLPNWVDTTARVPRHGPWPSWLACRPSHRALFGLHGKKARARHRGRGRAAVAGAFGRAIRSVR
jgi:colanic acid biosynthesis glycosyl transferase WcaI